MQQLDGNLPPVALCSAILVALMLQGCAGGATESTTGGGGRGGGNPSGAGGGDNGGGGGDNGGGGSGGGAGGGRAGTGGGAAGGSGLGGTSGGGGAGTGAGGSSPDGGGSDATGVASGVHVQYRCTDTYPGPTTSIGLNFIVENLGFIPVDFATFSMRYWFTSDSVTGLSAHCETIQPGQQLDCKNVVTTVKAVVPPRANADSYLDISITPSGTATGIGYMGMISQLTIRFQSAAPGFLQSNDYSFDPSVTAFADFPKVTAYAGDTLIWGVEP